MSRWDVAVDKLDLRGAYPENVATWSLNELASLIEAKVLDMQDGALHAGNDALDKANARAGAAEKERNELRAEVERLKAERAELGHIGASQYKAEVERLRSEANELESELVEVAEALGRIERPEGQGGYRRANGAAMARRIARLCLLASADAEASALRHEVERLKAELAQRPAPEQPALPTRGEIVRGLREACSHVVAREQFAVMSDYVITLLRRHALPTPAPQREWKPGDDAHVAFWGAVDAYASVWSNRANTSVDRQNAVAAVEAAVRKLAPVPAAEKGAKSTILETEHAEMKRRWEQAMRERDEARAEIQELQRKLHEAFDSEVESGHRDYVRIKEAEAEVERLKADLEEERRQCARNALELLREAQADREKAEAEISTRPSAPLLGGTSLSALHPRSSLSARLGCGGCTPLQRVASARWRGEAVKPSRDDLLAAMCEMRGVDVPCPACRGRGVQSYSSTATWRGGIGGQEFTMDQCDVCWGSGDAGRPWPNIRTLEAKRQAWEREQCAEWFARRIGASLSVCRRDLLLLADVIARERGCHRLPRRSV